MDSVPPQFVMLLLLMILGALVLFGALYLRYKSKEMKHRERMAALEKGLPVPVSNGPVAAPAKATPRVYLLRGMIWLFIGVGLTTLLLGVASSSQRQPRVEDAIEEKLWREKRLKELGATDEQLKQFESGFKPREREGVPWVVALIGLIPSGVGLAYLIFYRIEGNRGTSE
jgi:hypothetical protein